MALLPDRDAAKRRLASQTPTPPINAAPNPQPIGKGTVAPSVTLKRQRRSANKAAKQARRRNRH